MPGLLLAFAAIFAAAADHPSTARLLNIQELVTPNDYPRVALVNNQQGSVTVRLKIDQTGLVTSCKVIVSSGHQALDDQTCALYRARARFEPARDRRGRPVDSSYKQKTTWRLAASDAFPPMPRHAWMTRTTAAISSEGGILDCKVEVVGVSSSSQYCDFLRALVAHGSGNAEAKGPVASFSISETYFYPVETAKIASPPVLRDATNVGEQVSQIVIGADGTVSDCKGIRYSGVASPEKDVCAGLTQGRFEPASTGSASLTGTIVMRAYIRRHTVT